MRTAIPPLETLGPRIMVLGASNAGKSTLADAIARKSGLTPVFLDQLRFVPGSNWVERPDRDFAADHDAAILGEHWIIEGNYKALIAQRVARATSIVVLWDRPLPAFYRYLRRTLLEGRRIGTLAGNRDSLKWRMIHWILFAQPGRRGMYERTALDSGLPVVRAFGMSEVRRLYEAWRLGRQV